MNKDNKNRNRITIIALVACVIASFLISFFSGEDSASIANVFKKLFNSSNVVYTEENKSISINSAGNNPGAYTLEESGDWINQDEVEVTYNITTSAKGSTKPSDVILLVPTLYEEIGQEYQEEYLNIYGFAESFLKTPENRIKLVYYKGEEAIQLTDFTSDFNTIISAINNVKSVLNHHGVFATQFSYPESENKYVALKEVENIMQSYEHSDNKNVYALLMSTRYPYTCFTGQVGRSRGSNNLFANFEYDQLAEGEYYALKDMYPYLNINGIVSQYKEFHTSSYPPSLLIHELGYYTDHVYQRFNSDAHETNPFIRAINNYEEYDKFKVEIDLSDNYDFELSDYDTGSATIVNNKLIWDSSNELVTGESQSLRLIAKIKNENIQPNKYYQISNNTKISSRLYEEDEKVLNTNNTTVYKSMYNVNYNVSCLDTCNVSSYDTDYVRPFTNIDLTNKPLTSTESVFKGWSTGNRFTVTTSDVTANAIWTKLTLSKTMDGEVNTAIGHYFKYAVSQRSHIGSFKVEDVYFVDGTEETIPVPEDAIDVFDASVENNGSIIAWLVDNNHNGLYEYYVRGNGGVRLPADSSYLFNNTYYSHLKYMDVSKLITNEVQNLYGSFMYLAYIQDDVLIEGFDTWDVSNVTDTSYMFAYFGYDYYNNTYAKNSIELKGLENMNFSKLTKVYLMFDQFGYYTDTIKLKFGMNAPILTSMKNMFYECGKKAKHVDLDIGGINAPNNVDLQYFMSDAFEETTEFDFSSLAEWDVSNVNIFSNMFRGSFDNVEELDLSWLNEWNPESATNISYMFYDTGTNTKRIELDAHGWNMPILTNMSYAFSGLANAADYVYLNLNDWKTPSLSDYNSVFWHIFYNSKEAHMEIDNWDVSNGTNFRSFMHTAFENTPKVEFSMKNTITSNSLTGSGEWPFYKSFYNAKDLSVDISGWDLSHSTSIDRVFTDFGRLATDNFDFNISGWKNTQNIVSIYCLLTDVFTTGQEITLDFSGWDTSSLQSVNQIIYANSGKDITSITLDMSGWDLSKATFNMFALCVGSQNTIFNFNLSNAKVGQSVIASAMFKSLQSAKMYIDVSNWEFVNVTSFNKLFYNIGSSSKEIVVTGLDTWDTSTVTDMSYIFNYVSSTAEKLHFDGIDTWDTSHVTTFENAFSNFGYNATDVVLGDLSKWDTSSCTNFKNMFSTAFRNAQNFELDLSDWDLSHAIQINSMLSGIFGERESVNIGDLSSWDLSNVTDMYYAFGSIGSNGIADIGTLNLNSSASAKQTFNGSKGLKGVINIRKNIVIDQYTFSNTAKLEGSGLTLNYTSETEALVDSIIAGLAEGQYIYKGSLIE